MVGGEYGAGCMAVLVYSPFPTHYLPFLNGSSACRASSSARSFSAWPAWPRTQAHSIWCGASAVSRRCHRSAFLTGLLSAVIQPLRLPTVDPAGDAVPQIDRIGVQPDAAGPLQRLERGDRRHQLHAVVGGQRLAARQLLLDGRRSAGRRPSRRARDCPNRRRR